MPLRNKDDKEPVEEEQRIKPFYHVEQQIVQRIQHFYLSSIIGEAGYYVEMIHHIASANPGEIIYIHLNTPGGNLATGVQIINAMKASQAHVVCSIESESHSLGTLIFLAADEFIVHDNTMMMFHNFSGMTGGKGHEQRSQLDAIEKWFNNLARQIYIPFLTEDEFHSIEQGSDLYFHSEEIRTRLEAMVKVLEAEKAKEDAPKEKKTRKRAPAKPKSKNLDGWK